MTRYTIEILTDLDSDRLDRVGILAEYLNDAGCDQYTLVDSEFVDSDTREGHETEFWLMTFDTDHEFSEEVMEEHCIDAL